MSEVQRPKKTSKRKRVTICFIILLLLILVLVYLLYKYRIVFIHNPSVNSDDDSINYLLEVNLKKIVKYVNTTRHVLDTIRDEEAYFTPLKLRY